MKQVQFVACANCNAALPVTKQGIEIICIYCESTNVSYENLEVIELDQEFHSIRNEYFEITVMGILGL